MDNNKPITFTAKINGDGKELILSRQSQMRANGAAKRSLSEVANILLKEYSKLIHNGEKNL
jgi:hypothetical protein